jgi:hypothetical protein
VLLLLSLFAVQGEALINDRISYLALGFALYSVSCCMRIQVSCC